MYTISNDSLLFRFHGWKNSVSGILNNPICFIFAVITNMSFYEITEVDENDGLEKSKEKVKHEAQNKNSDNDSKGKVTTHQMNDNEELEIVSISVVTKNNFHQIRKEENEDDLNMNEINSLTNHDNDSDINLAQEEIIKGEVANIKNNTDGEEFEMVSVSNGSENIVGTPDENISTPYVDDNELPNNQEKRMIFSYHQSNVLYILFLLGYGVGLGLDIWFQMYR